MLHCAWLFCCSHCLGNSGATCTSKGYDSWATDYAGPGGKQATEPGQVRSFPQVQADPAAPAWSTTVRAWCRCTCATPHRTPCLPSSCSAPLVPPHLLKHRSTSVSCDRNALSCAAVPPSLAVLCQRARLLRHPAGVRPCSRKRLRRSAAQSQNPEPTAGVLRQGPRSGRAPRRGAPRRQRAPTWRPQSRRAGSGSAPTLQTWTAAAMHRRSCRRRCRAGCGRLPCAEGLAYTSSCASWQRISANDAS